MSGICGVVSFNGRVDRDVIGTMLSAISHRGPDAESIYVDESLAFGYAALATTPESESDTQPLSDRSGAIRIVVDGRIDNRDELLKLLGPAPDVSREAPDSVLFLAAYSQWGADFVSRIVGDFAIVIWDSRTKQVVCARDLVGARPLYFHYSGDLFIFSSEVQGVLRHPALQKRPNEDFIAEALCSRFVSPEATIIKDVMRLRPGFVRVFSGAGTWTHRFWTGENITEIRYRDDAEYKEHLLEVYATVISSFLRCNRRKLGIRLSGGVDSGSLAAMVQRSIAQTGWPAAEALSVAAPGEPGDESDFTRLSANHLRLPLHTVPPFAPSVRFLLEQAKRYDDLPEYPNGLSVEGLRRVAQSRRLNVLFTGFGGGEWFSGNPSHLSDLLAAGHLREFVAVARIFHRAGHSWKSLLRISLTEGRPRALEIYGRMRTAGVSLPWVAPKLASRLPRLDSCFGNGLSNNLRTSQANTFLRASSATDVHLTEFEERADGRYGIEGRHPLNDRRIIELTLGLPFDQKRTPGGPSKFLLRNSMEGLVHDAVRLREESTSGSYSVLRVLCANDSAQIFRRLLIGDLGWVNCKSIQIAYENLLADFGRGCYSSGNTVRLWMVLAVELWARALYNEDA